MILLQQNLLYYYKLIPEDKQLAVSITSVPDLGADGVVALHSLETNCDTLLHLNHHDIIGKHHFIYQYCIDIAV